MTHKMPPWSYTALTNFENCPHKYFETRVAKSVPDLPGEAAIWGDRVHKALEEAVKTGKPLPEGMEQWQKYPDKFRKVWKDDVVVFTEKQLAVNKFFIPVKWEAKDAWCRGIVDVGVVKGGHVFAADWKTGKRKPESTQLMLFAGLLFSHFPYAKIIDTMFIWLKDKKSDKERYEEKDKAAIWNAFLPRVAKMEQAFTEDRWEKRSSGLCRGWCPVKSCEFNEPRRS